MKTVIDDIVKVWCTGLRITQKQFAESLGVSESRLLRLRRGDQWPYREFLDSLYLVTGLGETSFLVERVLDNQKRIQELEFSNTTNKERVDRDKEKILIRLANGETKSDIALDYGVSLAQFSTITRHWGVRKRYKDLSAWNDQLLRCHARGLSLADTHRCLEQSYADFDLSLNQVRERLDLLGGLRRVTIKSRREELVKDYKSGISIPKLAVKYRTTRNTIYNYLSRWGALKEAKISSEVLRADRDSGLSYQQIADKHGMKYNAVYKRLVRSVK